MRVLKKLRLERGMSQKQLAEACGVPVNMISPMEYGALPSYYRRKYSNDGLNKLAEFFGMSDNPTKLLEWEED